jgi:hypothetical protein
MLSFLYKYGSIGQHQIGLIGLGVIIVGISLAVAIAQFGSQSMDANKDGVTSTLINIGADAYQYKLRPGVMGGGGNTYLGYNVPNRLKSDEHALSYTAGKITSNRCQIVAISLVNTGWVATCTINDTGNTSITYHGW